MADIKLDSVVTSDRGPTGQRIAFKLSATPVMGWLECFNANLSGEPTLLNCSVSLPMNSNVVTVTSAQPFPPKLIQDALNAVITKANTANDDFQKQISELKF
ncbi:MAG TPA: hypothetical protein VI756_13955 [Blastocatellia bacterium]